MVEGIRPLHLLILCLGFTLSFWDIFNVPYVISYAGKSFDLPQSSPEVNLPLTAEMMGYFVGGAINGFIGTRMGRKTGLLSSMILVTVGSALAFSSASFLQLTLAEFVIGLGIEGEIALVPTYISETTTPENRGKAVGIVTVGGFAVSMTVGPFAVLLGQGNWRLLYLASLLLSAVAVLTRLKLPESRLWRPMRIQIQWRKTKRLLLLLLAWSLSYAAGYSFFSNPLFLLLGDKGFQNVQLAYTYILYGDPLGVLIATLINDKLERRISSSLVNVISGILMISMPLTRGTWTLLVGFAAMLTQGMKFPPMYTYTAETLSDDMRAVGSGIADGLGHLGGAVGPLAINWLYNLSPFLSFGVMGTISALGGAALALGPNTKNRKLSEIL